jgi:thiamine-monophosphate kinase
MPGTLGALGEDAWIRRLVRRCGAQAPPPPLGIGDDASRLRPRAGHDLVWTTDLLVEDVHFRRSWGEPRRLGRKALAVNLSDVAAMGAVPCGFLLGLSAPGSLPLTWLDGVAAGLADAARRAGAPCLGGDTTGSSGPVSLGITAAGSLPRGTLLTRRGARPGDGLWLSGPLGAAAAGLRLLEAGFRPGRPGPRPLQRAARAALLALLDPRPPLDLGPWLARRGLARAAIDLSDGLATDLGRLCGASGVGARVDLEAIPVHRCVGPLADWLGDDPAGVAVQGGEDYELLFTVPRGREAVLRRTRRVPRPVRIGEITRGGLVVRGPGGRETPLEAGGFGHFRPAEG